MKNILIVDDPLQLPRGLQDEFGLKGHSVFFAPTGEAAIMKLNSYNPDLIICNITSARISGIVLLFYLSHTAETIPCIALVDQSKYEPEYFVEMASALKVKKILFEPVTMESIIKTVVEVLA